MVLYIDGDYVAVLNNSNGAALLRFGSNMTDEEAMGAPRKAPVRD